MCSYTSLMWLAAVDFLGLTNAKLLLLIERYLGVCLEVSVESTETE